MKTEELRRYERMYREMRRQFGTPLLTFDHPGRPEARNWQRGKRRPEGGGREGCEEDGLR